MAAQPNAADAAWEARQKAWDEEENRRNAQEDAATLKAGGKLPGTWDTAGPGTSQALFTNPGTGFYNAREDAYSGMGGANAYQPPEQRDWERAQALLAMENRNQAPSTLQGKSTPTPPWSEPRPRFQSPGKMDSTETDYGLWDHILNSAKGHYAHEGEMQQRSMDEIGQYLESGGKGPLQSPEVQDWMMNKAFAMAAGVGLGGGIAGRSSWAPRAQAPEAALPQMPYRPRSGMMDPNLTPRPAGMPRSGGQMLGPEPPAVSRPGQELAPYGQGAAQFPQPGPTSWPNGTMEPANLNWLRNSVDPRGQQFSDTLRQYYNPSTLSPTGPKLPGELMNLLQNFYSRP